MVKTTAVVFELPVSTLLEILGLVGLVVVGF